MKRLGLVLLLAAATAARAQRACDAVTADSANPLAAAQDAAEAGKALFGQMNCAGCHAYDLTGGMGPDLTDNSWLYGGEPGEIFRSIADGTPPGMPAWKDKLTPDKIWQIVTYIQSKHAN